MYFLCMGLAQCEVDKLFPWDIQLSVTLFCETVFNYVKRFGTFFLCERLSKQTMGPAYPGE
jgi:hypothetical protein